MKKLLVLCLVMAMGSASFGAMTGLVAIDPATDMPLDRDVAPSEIIIIGVQSDVDISGLLIRKITDDATPMGTATPGPLTANFTVNRQDGSEWLVNAGNVLFMREGGAAIGGSINPFGGTPVPANELLYSFEYHVPDVPPSTYITLAVGDVPPSASTWLPTGGANTEGFGTAVIHVIPEPMTLSLLALGGLGLIRRRRA